MIDLNVNSVKMTIRKTKPSSKGSYLQTIRNVEVKTESAHGYRFITKHCYGVTHTDTIGGRRRGRERGRERQTNNSKERQ